MNVRSPAVVLPSVRRNASLASIWLVLLALAGCNVAPAPDAGAATATPPFVGGDDSVSWHGRLPCADCTAIDTRLQLQRAGDQRAYVLTEIYLANDDQRRFDQRGRWQRHAQLLILHGDDGARRVYALLPDGRLQARDRHGRPLRAGDDAVLLPQQ